MNKHEGCTRGYRHLSKSWHGPYTLAHSKRNLVDEIMIGMYDVEEGGTTGEFSVEWNRLGDRVVPQLKVYDDAWDALLEFQDMLEAMKLHDDKTISPDEFCDILEDCDIINMTSTEYGDTT